MANVLEILIKAKDQDTSKTLKNLSNDLKGAGKDLGAFSKAMGVALPAATVVGAATAIGLALKSSAEDWANYNEEMRKMSIATGASVEDLSRMMQAADDLGVSMSSLQTALVIASKNGVEVSIDSIAELSDRMLAMTDLKERNAEFAKTFGRQWAESAPFLLSGSEAIKKNTAAINDNLVATEKSVSDSRRYKVAIDNLTDTWTGLRNQAGAIVLPIATEGFDIATTGLKKLIQTGQDYVSYYAAVQRAEDLHILTQGQLNQVHGRVRYGILSLAEATDYLNARIDASIDPLTKSDIAKRKAAAAAWELKNSNEAAAESSDALAKAEEAARAAAEQSASIYNAAKTSMEAYGGSAAIQAEALEYLAIATGATDQQTLFFSEKISAVTRLMEEKFITLDQWKYYVDQLASGTVDAAGAVSLLNGYIKNLPKETRLRIYVETYGVNYGTTGGRQPASGEDRANWLLNPEEKEPGGARGLDMIVPPGYPNDSYRVRATSGERVMIIPSGSNPSSPVVGNSPSTNYFNLTVISNAPAENVVEDYELMRAWMV